MSFLRRISHVASRISANGLRVRSLKTPTSRTPLAHSVEIGHDAPTALVPGLSMSSKSLAAAILVVLSAGFARAQITPITSGLPENANNYGFSLSPGYETPMSAQSVRDMEIERRYNETLKKIPNKQPSNDPWAGVRAAPVADRHRPM